MRRSAFIVAAIAWAAVQSATAAGPAAAPLTARERALVVSALQGSEELTAAPPESLSDDVLQASVRRHATAELGLRLQPSQIDPIWAIEPPRRLVEAEFDQARRAGGLDLWLQGLAPASAAYRALIGARCRYRQIVDSGGWPGLPAKAVLRPGATGSVVADLRRRLQIEGYLADAQGGGQAFDAPLKEAVMAFQRRHDLEPDGAVGPGTRDALNITAEQRLVQVEANLERWRWVRALPPDRLEVNVAAAEAVLYADGAPTLTMRTVVGDPAHQTPMFTSQLASVVINPPWNVPSSIAVKELWPKERAQPGYLRRNGYTVIDGALRQAPGAGNALGRVKFDFPSPFGVYLHDTPGRGAFARSFRALSHGCIRLEKPRELAAALLGAQGWTADRIDAAIDSGETRRIQLEGRLPLFVLYWTVEPQADGSLQFHQDPYGWDAKLTTALAREGGRGSLRQRAADTECAAAKPHA
jgi:murein L,D-transpeptidase YcbB/YkuD